jgi:ribosomal protein L11 methylase PrmA
MVFDLGSNTGEYSLLASRHSDYVVSMDSDCQCIDMLYSHLRKNNIKNILPLVVDVVNPSPDLGWRLKEYPAIFSRESPDMVICLALMHHVVIGKNVPLKEFIEWLVRLAPNLIIEFVSKTDPMVKLLLQNRDDVYGDYTRKACTSYLEELCVIKKIVKLQSNTRVLYWVKRKVGDGKVDTCN